MSATKKVRKFNRTKAICWAANDCAPSNCAALLDFSPDLTFSLLSRSSDSSLAKGCGTITGRELKRLHWSTYSANGHECGGGSSALMLVGQRFRVLAEARHLGTKVATVFAKLELNYSRSRRTAFPYLFISYTHQQCAQMWKKENKRFCATQGVDESWEKHRRQ